MIVKTKHFSIFDTDVAVDAGWHCQFTSGIVDIYLFTLFRSDFAYTHFQFLVYFYCFIYFFFFTFDFAFSSSVVRSVWSVWFLHHLLSFVLFIWIDGPSANPLLAQFFFSLPLAISRCVSLSLSVSVVSSPCSKLCSYFETAAMFLYWLTGYKQQHENILFLLFNGFHFVCCCCFASSFILTRWIRTHILLWYSLWFPLGVNTVWRNVFHRFNPIVWRSWPWL